MAVLPGYASVARASEVLHLAPRSVRDLIYRGRLPSLRIGRLHYVRTADLDFERRRRLGVPLPRRRAHAATRGAVSAARRPRPIRPHVDPVARHQRAAERAALVSQWARRHQPEMAEPRVPFSETVLTAPSTCEVCGRGLRPGSRALKPAAGPSGHVCLTCGRRALLQWADQRRLEAAAARSMARDLGARASASPAAPHPGRLSASPRSGRRGRRRAPATWTMLPPLKAAAAECSTASAPRPAAGSWRSGRTDPC